MIKSIQSLLELQVLESKCQELQKQWDSCQKNKTLLEVREGKVIEDLEIAKINLKERKKNYQTQELQLNHLEEVLVQQKAKQACVKKAEDYQSLEKANEVVAQKISELQDQLLMELDAIDAEEKDLQKQTDDTQLLITELKNQKLKLVQQISACEKNLQSAQAQVEKYEKNLSGAFYEAYLNLRKCNKVMPRVVAVKDGKCLGCFLTLSKETTDHLNDENSPQFCEHCGRILYTESSI